jgi:hypothetical protein
MQHNPADTFAGWIDLWGMTNIEVRFADNSDDRRSVDREFPSRASVKRESRACETKNMVLISHHFFCRYFNNDDARFAAGRIYERNMSIAVSFDFQGNDAARKGEPIILNPSTL